MKDNRKNMNWFSKLLLLKNHLGLTVVGLLFAVIGGKTVLSGAGDGSPVPLVFTLLGAAAAALGIVKTVKELSTPASGKRQFDRVDSRKAAEMQAQAVNNENEPMEDFVYHFTGKLNQSQVMKDSEGNVVYEAICEKMSILKDTPFLFRNRITGEESRKMVGHTRSTAVGIVSGISETVSSVFNIDSISVWDVLAQMGYGFRFSMNGIAAHYDVAHWGKNAGYAQLAGTGVMNPKYKDNPLGQVPTNGIFQIRCRRSDVPGFFLICFALSRTEKAAD